MNPIKNGIKIFKELINKFGSEKISDQDIIIEFFNLLISKTNGGVILDFLDLDNWDKIESFDFDKDKGLLTLIWHDYRGIEEKQEEKMLRQACFPASLYSLGIIVNSIVPFDGEDSAIFLINGFSRTLKEIKSFYKPNTSEFEIFDDSFFEKRVIRKYNNEWEIINFQCTPIYSLALIPKNCGISTSNSKKFLYLYNIIECHKRLSNIYKSLDNINKSEHDLICEKVNTARRIMESVLKIVCCYRDIKIKENYSQLTLGNLINCVKKIEKPEVKHILNKMPELLNEFSHDSGRLIELKKAKEACGLVLLYIKLFLLEIQSNDKFLNS
jgi:hypothetical protein